jgi:hypothetical protein
MKKFLLIETALLSAFIAVLTCVSLVKSHDDNFSASIDMQTSVQKSATPATTSTHSVYKLGGVYPEP